MLPSAKDFDHRKLLGDTSDFDNALQKVEAKFNSILEERYNEAAEEQMRLCNKIKAVDKHAQESTSRLSATSKVQYTKLKESIEDLDAQINRVSTAISQVVDDLYKIDKLLPATEQLLAPKLPNQEQFPHLTKIMLEKELIQPVAVQGVAAEVELDPQFAQAAMLQEDVDYVRAKLRAFRNDN